MLLVVQTLAELFILRTTMCFVFKEVNGNRNAAETSPSDNRLSRNRRHLCEETHKARPMKGRRHEVDRRVSIMRKSAATRFRQPDATVNLHMD